MSILTLINDIGFLPGPWEEMGTFGTVLHHALTKEKIGIIDIEPLGKMDYNLTVEYKGKQKKVKLTGSSSAEKVVKKIKG